MIAFAATAALGVLFAYTYVIASKNFYTQGSWVGNSLANDCGLLDGQVESLEALSIFTLVTGLYIGLTVRKKVTSKCTPFEILGRATVAAVLATPFIVVVLLVSIDPWAQYVLNLVMYGCLTFVVFGCTDLLCVSVGIGELVPPSRSELKKEADPEAEPLILNS